MTQNILVMEVVNPAFEAPGDMSLPNCPVITATWMPTPYVLALDELLGTAYSEKRASPEKTNYKFGVATADQESGWLITIEKPVGISPPLMPNESFVVMVNPLAWDKTIQTVNSANGCLGPDQSLTLSSGQSGGIRISTSDTTTLLLSTRYCKVFFFGCIDSSGHADLAIFGEPAFWDLFGGRKVTIRWVANPGDGP